MRALRSWKTWALLLLAVAITATAVAQRSYPDTTHSFDRGDNGLWIGHKWYTGHEVRTGDRVPYVDVDRLVDRLRAERIRFVFVHAGPLLADGSVEHSADPLFTALRRAYPDGVFLAWLGARLDKVHLEDEGWREAVIETVERMRAEGFDGVQFDLEPLRDGHPGYLELLASVRHAMGEEWFISQATPRSAPFGFSVGPFRQSFWSGAFYRATMDLADQTVLMAYDVNLPLAIAYVAFVRDQTQRLVRWACRADRHEILIGIPSYHDVPAFSDPSVENIENAALGVRSALEGFDSAPECFRGVSIYSNWVTDDLEWRQLRDHWQQPGTSAQFP